MRDGYVDRDVLSAQAKPVPSFRRQAAERFAAVLAADLDVLKSERAADAAAESFGDGFLDGEPPADEFDAAPTAVSRRHLPFAFRQDPLAKPRAGRPVHSFLDPLQRSEIMSNSDDQSLNRLT
jgi:hypothetical protein